MAKDSGVHEDVRRASADLVALWRESFREARESALCRASQGGGTPTLRAEAPTKPVPGPRRSALRTPLCSPRTRVRDGVLGGPPGSTPAGALRAPFGGPDGGAPSGCSPSSTAPAAPAPETVCADEACAPQSLP